MLKLWIVIYVAGQLAVSLGPLPYGMEECKQRIAAEKAHGPDHPEFLGNYDWDRDIRFACELHAERPKAEEK